MNKYALRHSALALTISSALAGTASAATITVTTAADGPVGAVAGCTLREAVASANSGNSQGGCTAGSAAADSIVFDPSLAYSTITLSAGPIEITSSLTITGPVNGDPAGLVIDGDNLSRLFQIDGPSAIAPITTNLGQMTLTRGRATGTSQYGGGIRAQFANLNLDHALITGNSISVTADGPYSGTGALGGGVVVIEGSASVTDSIISGNSVISYASGQNATASALGGGLVIVSGAASVVNSTIANNISQAHANGESGFATAAGGMVMVEGTLVIVDSDISGNSVVAIADGTDSESNAYGGGMFVRAAESTIHGSTISGNSIVADDRAVGGGMVAAWDDFTVTNSTISGNTAVASTTQGGGLLVFGIEDEVGDDDIPASLFLRHSTVAFNHASNGVDGIEWSLNGASSLFLESSLIVQGGPDETACSNPAKYSTTLATDTTCTGVATDLVDIKLTGLGNNGGPTPTHGLLPGSVAINAIGECSTEVTLDQRGLPRPGSGSAACDIGAFELQQDDNLDVVFSDRFEQ